MKKFYRCEVCGRESENSLLVESCEEKHKIDNKEKTMPSNSVICPDCEGAGGHRGKDGIDWYGCTTCDGVGFVIPTKTITTETTIYQKIKN